MLDLSVELALALPAAGALSVWIVAAFAMDECRRDGSGLPRWLEEAMPLRGRWLRLFLAAPRLLFLFVVLFAGLFGVLLVGVAVIAAVARRLLQG